MAPDGSASPFRRLNWHALSAAVAFWAGRQGRPDFSAPAVASPSPATAAVEPRLGAASPEFGSDCHCDVPSVAFGSAEAAEVLAEHVERNVPLRIVGLPPSAAVAFGDAALAELAGGRVVELRAMTADGQVPKKGLRRNGTLAEALSGGPLSADWYVAQVSVPQKLPELLFPLVGEGQPLSMIGMGMGKVWRAHAGAPLAASPYLYYYGGSADSVCDADCVAGRRHGRGPALYMHYDAADNFLHVVDGEKEFWLYDPFQASSVLYGSNAEHGNASPVNVEDKNATAQNHPLFKHAMPRRCTLRKGEALYLPMYWFHRVRSGSQRTLSLAHFNKGEPSKKAFFQKILCGYSLKPAAFECGSSKR